MPTRSCSHGRECCILQCYSWHTPGHNNHNHDHKHHHNQYHRYQILVNHPNQWKPVESSITTISPSDWPYSSFPSFIHLPAYPATSVAVSSYSALQYIFTDPYSHQQYPIRGTQFTVALQSTTITSPQILRIQLSLLCSSCATKRESRY